MQTLMVINGYLRMRHYRPALNLTKSALFSISSVNRPQYHPILRSPLESALVEKLRISDIRTSMQSNMNHLGKYALKFRVSKANQIIDVVSINTFARGNQHSQANLTFETQRKTFLLVSASPCRVSRPAIEFSGSRPIYAHPPHRVYLHPFLLHLKSVTESSQRTEQCF